MTKRIANKLPLLAAAGVACVMLAGVPASAQDYYGSADDYYSAPGYGPNEEVIVTAPQPRYEPRTGTLGGRIENVSLSRDVRYDDLDLTTDYGARELRERIRYTAREECRQLDTMYPISADGSPPCYRTAVDNGMEQADEAIGQARSYADRD